MLFRSNGTDVDLHLGPLSLLAFHLGHLWKLEQSKRLGEPDEVEVFDAEDVRRLVLRVRARERDERLGAL